MKLWVGNLGAFPRPKPKMVMTAKDEEEACELAQKEEYFSRKMSFFFVASSPWGDLLRVKKEWG